jgi:hypothetical protein
MLVAIRPWRISIELRSGDGILLQKVAAARCRSEAHAVLPSLAPLVDGQYYALSVSPEVLYVHPWIHHHYC